MMPTQLKRAFTLSSNIVMTLRFLERWYRGDQFLGRGGGGGSFVYLVNIFCVIDLLMDL